MDMGKISQLRDDMPELHDIVDMKGFIDWYMANHPEIDSYNKFAQFVHVASSTIDDYIKGKRKPEVPIIKRIAQRTNTDPVVLLKIVYPDFVDDNTLSAADELLAQSINRLPNPIRDVIVKLIRFYTGE